ncbi:MAG: hypothetical protein U0163_10265, partial [Gemmatimonadaceae bacterium]
LGAKSSHGTWYAFVWTPEAGMRFPIVSSENTYATGVNNNGEVVGLKSAPNPLTEAFVWTEQGGERDATPPGPSGGVPFDITSSARPAPTSISHDQS